MNTEKPSSSEPAKCPNCSSPLPDHAPQGLCPKCLFAGLGAETLDDASASVRPPVPTPEELAPHFPQLEILDCLGRGGMGVVYKARQKSLNRLVALKLLAPERVGDPVFAERFSHEAQALARLNHPNIVTIFDAGEEHDLAFIAMEFLKGRDLAPYIKPDNLLPQPKVLSIVARVAEALSYAHVNNVVHRDIKPANIMYDLESDTVKVTDFGIARITDSSKTKTGMVLGTPSYMSPEQLAGKKIEGRSDLFSLGATLYQLLSGQLPFRGDSMAQLMFKIANEPHADILNYIPDLAPGLVAIIDRSLAKNPDDRFQTGEELAGAIRACMAGGGDPAAQSDIVDIGL